MADRVARSPRVPEKVVQAQVVELLRSVGGKVYTIGRPPRRDSAHKGTGIGIGIPDLLVHLPEGPRCPEPGQTWRRQAHQLWVEVKAKGGRLSAEQASFRDFCGLAGVPHVVGGMDEVLDYLAEHGYVREHPALYRRVSA